MSDSFTSYAEPVATFADGTTIPLLGFGTWQISDDDAERAVQHALKVGYRHIDTATAYRNEAGVGRGLRKSGVRREDVFLTTKLPPNKFGENHLGVLQDSLRMLGVDAVDLWLVHAPGGENYDEPSPEVWQSFITAQEQGLTRSIGVSNYSLEQIDVLVEATGVTPAINQIEWNPFLYDPAVADGHRERGIVLEGYSPLNASNLKDETLVKIGDDHDVTAADVILAWHVMHGVVVLPRSVHEDRIESNAAGAMVELDEDEMARIDALAGTWAPPQD